MKAKCWRRCFQTVVLEKTLESPLDCKEIKLVSPKGNQSWIFIGRIDAEVETPILWPPDAKKWLIGKYPDDEKGTTEDEMVGWHHQLDGPEIEQAPSVGDGQGRLACYSPWGCKESDTTEWLIWTEESCSNLENPACTHSALFVCPSLLFMLLLFLFTTNFHITKAGDKC